MTEPAAAPPSSRLPRRRAARRLALLSILVAALTSPWWGRAVLSRLAFFRLRSVEVTGARYTDPAEIIALLGVDTTASLWDDTDPLARRAARHPQVREARVGRRLPGTLVVRVTERVPVAFVPTSRGLRAVEAGGQELPIDPSRIRVDLPVVPSRDTSVLRVLAELHEREPRLYARVSAARRSGRDELVLDVGALQVRAMLGVTADRLADIIPVEADLARRQVRATELDVRYRDQVIARRP